MSARNVPQRLKPEDYQLYRRSFTLDLETCSTPLWDTVKPRDAFQKNSLTAEDRVMVRQRGQYFDFAATVPESGAR